MMAFRVAVGATLGGSPVFGIWVFPSVVHQNGLALDSRIQGMRESKMEFGDSGV